MGKEKVSKQSTQGDVNVWHLADDILSEVNILQNVQRFYVDDVLQLTFVLESKEEALQRLGVLDFIGEAILGRMEEIQEGLSTLMRLIRALQENKNSHMLPT